MLGRLFAGAAVVALMSTPVLVPGVAEASSKSTQASAKAYGASHGHSSHGKSDHKKAKKPKKPKHHHGGGDDGDDDCPES